MKAYTDYPILSLGDCSGKEALIREVEILYYDQDKYCKVIVEGIEEEIKLGYLYTKAVTCKEAYEQKLLINRQYIKNKRGHFKSSKAAQITKSYVVYPPNYDRSFGPFYYKFLDKAWKRACSLGIGSEVVQCVSVRHKDGSASSVTGEHYWTVEK